jgi:hypothetical protein
VVEHTITADREVLDALQRAKARAQGVIIDAVVNDTVLLIPDQSDIIDISVNSDEFDVSSCY